MDDILGYLNSLSNPLRLVVFVGIAVGIHGIVKAIMMRFVELENAMGATVFIPNRTINNVINYPRGYIRCIVDITLRGDESAQNATEATATRLMVTMLQQFPGIFVYPPSNEGRMRFGEGKVVLRLKFRIWPTRQQPIESAFYEELVAELTQADCGYKRWMVTISYEVEARIERQVRPWLWNKKAG